jgi:hypothetical protein
MAQRKKFLLRIPPELWEEMNRWAADDLRSVNGQIEFVLQQAIRQRRREKTPKNKDEESS